MRFYWNRTTNQERNFGITISILTVYVMMAVMIINLPETEYGQIQYGDSTEISPSYNPYLLEPNSKIIPEDELPYYDFTMENFDTDDKSVIYDNNKGQEYMGCLSSNGWYRYYYDTQKFECIIKLIVTPQGQV